MILTGTHLGGRTLSTPEVSKARKRFLAVASVFLAVTKQAGKFGGFMGDKLWGGRFKKNIDKSFFEFEKSLQYDYKLAEFDILHSLIHIQALYLEGFLSKKELDSLSKSLRTVLVEIKEKGVDVSLDIEDIHTYIQKKVEKKAGKAAEKLHTLRSRNDQVSFDERMYCLEHSLTVGLKIEEVIASLEFLADKYKDYNFPGYTHTQRAQVVKFSSYILAYRQMFLRDSRRLENFYNRIYAFVGAGALAGSVLLGRAYGQALKRLFPKLRAKIKPSGNTIDTVADRDYVVEFLSVLSIIQMHISRLSGDFILYSSQEFNLLELPEEYCTGSSLMPQKKNPDFLELARGYTGRVYGNLISVLVMMKGLVLSYNRDMQLDKEPLFSSLEIVEKELGLLSGMLRKVKLNAAALKNVLFDDALYATNLAEYLVRKGESFSKAHYAVGRLMAYCRHKSIKIKDISASGLKKFHKFLDKEELVKILPKE